MAFIAEITDDRTDETLATYEVGDDEILDCDRFALRFAEENEMALSPKTGHVLVGCADFTVTLREPGRPRCIVWTSESYYVAMH